MDLAPRGHHWQCRVLASHPLCPLPSSERSGEHPARGSQGPGMVPGHHHSQAELGSGSSGQKILTSGDEPRQVSAPSLLPAHPRLGPGPLQTGHSRLGPGRPSPRSLAGLTSELAAPRSLCAKPRVGGTFHTLLLPAWSQDWEGFGAAARESPLHCSGEPCCLLAMAKPKDPGGCLQDQPWHSCPTDSLPQGKPAPWEIPQGVWSMFQTPICGKAPRGGEGSRTWS